MRITQSMMSGTMMHNLQNNYNRMNKYQEQLLTQRQLNRPSDNPGGVASALNYRQEVSFTTKFSENAEDADSWMKFTDSVMLETTSIVQRLSELAVQAGTDTMPEDARINIKQEVDQLYEQLVLLGNSQFKGKYIFNGERVDQKPYPEDPANQNYTLDTGVVEYQIGAGVTVPVNMVGNSVFGEFGSADGLFKVVDNMKQALNNDNTAGIQNVITQLQTSLQNITSAQAEIGVSRIVWSSL